MGVRPEERAHMGLFKRGKGISNFGPSVSLVVIAEMGKARLPGPIERGGGERPERSKSRR